MRVINYIMCIRKTSTAMRTGIGHRAKARSIGRKCFVLCPNARLTLISYSSYVDNRKFRRDFPI